MSRFFNDEISLSQFFMLYGWGILLTVNAITSICWSIWVTKKLRFLLRKDRLKQWADAYEQEKLH